MQKKSPAPQEPTEEWEADNCLASFHACDKRSVSCIQGQVDGLGAGVGMKGQQKRKSFPKEALHSWRKGGLGVEGSKSRSLDWSKERLAVEVPTCHLKEPRLTLPRDGGPWRRQVRGSDLFQCLRQVTWGTFLAGQWLRHHASTAKGTGLIPVPGSKIPLATRRGHKTKSTHTQRGHWQLQEEQA